MPLFYYIDLRINNIDENKKSIRYVKKSYCIYDVIFLISKTFWIWTQTVNVNSSLAVLTWAAIICSSSSLVTMTVLWLYRPWAISCRASGFLVPLAFLIFARLFWNHIFIWASFNPSSLASSCRRLSVKYRFSVNSFLSLDNWSPLNAVRGLFSSCCCLSFFFTRLVRGPKRKKETNFQLLTVNT